MSTLFNDKPGRLDLSDESRSGRQPHFPSRLDIANNSTADQGISDFDGLSGHGAVFTDKEKLLRRELLPLQGPVHVDAALKLEDTIEHPYHAR